MLLGIPDTFDLEIDTESSKPIVISDEIRLFKPLYRGVPQTFEDELTSLTKSFNTIIDLQQNEVKNMIENETRKLHLRRQEEERKRQELERERALAEQRHKQEEEARLKKLEEERKFQQEQERLKQLEQQKKEQEQKKKDEEAAKLKALELEKINAENNKYLVVEKEFNKFKQRIETIKKDIVEPVNANKELKKQIGMVRRKLNPKFGQLSSSMSQLNRITSEIIEIVNSLPNEPTIVQFIYNFIAKALISQAETEIIVQANAALPLARLASNLINQFPELNEFLMARFVKKCPLIIGYTCSIDTEAGRAKMGWKRNSAGKWEESDKYDERVSGICSLFSVLTRLSNPLYPMAMSWTMLARIANTKLDLITNVHFFCMSNWWDTCGVFFVQRYGNQGVKLLSLLAFELTVKFNKLPASTRLHILGEEGISVHMKCIKDMES